jgi:putative phosphoribosyl transferase
MVTLPLTAHGPLLACPEDGACDDQRYAERRACGRQLAERLHEFRGGRALVLALPPGGVVVAWELAHTLRLSLDVLLACEFYVPRYPAAVAGAISEGGGLCLNRAALRLPDVTPGLIWGEAKRARQELKELVARYRGGRALPALSRRSIILVDDGLGVGLSQLAALQSLRHAHAHRCIVATPLALPAAAERVRHVADDLVVLHEATGHNDGAPGWRSVLGDDEMVTLLARSVAG